MEKPKISVIIPVYNGQKTLEKSLESIFRSDYKNFEVIVVDDHSDDNSVRIAKRFPCKIIKLKKNCGGGCARNIGAKSAKGDILLFIDSDIIIPENCMQYGIDYFSEHKKVSALLGIFSTHLIYKNFFSNYKHLYLRYYFLNQGKCTHTLNTSLTFIKRGVFEKFKGFDINIKSVISEDAELGMRLTENCYIIHQSKKLEMEHMKYYSFRDFLNTEFVRSKRIFIAFANKFLEGKRGKKRKGNFFFFKPINIYLSIPLVYLMILSFVLSGLHSIFLLMGFILLMLFIIVNFDFWMLIRRERNILFSIKASFVNFLSMIWMGIGIICALFELIPRFLNKHV